MSAFLLDLFACAGGDVELGLSAPAVDECEELCVTISATNAGKPLAFQAVSAQVGNSALGANTNTDSEGLATLCGPAPEVGVQTVVVRAGEVTASAQTEVFAFGYAGGLLRNSAPLTELSWTPTFTRAQESPVLAPGPSGAWDSVAVALPSVAATDPGFAMWYAGASGGDYVIGAATSPDGVEWAREAGNPLLEGSGTTGAWDRYSVNDPMLLRTDTGWALLHDGRAETNGNLSIGLATGPSPTSVTEVPESPVFTWTSEDEPWAGRAVAHPGALIDGQGFWELWYSTGLQKIGYAYSKDGLSWRRYCHNPVFVPGDDTTWEGSTVKATEVIEVEGGYAMTYSAGGSGKFQVGWAMSHDGLHWVRADAPVLSPTGSGWERQAVLSAPLVRVGSELWMWYTGTDGTGSSIGLAKTLWEGGE